MGSSGPVVRWTTTFAGGNAGASAGGAAAAARNGGLRNGGSGVNINGGNRDGGHAPWRRVSGDFCIDLAKEDTRKQHPVRHMRGAFVTLTLPGVHQY